MYLLGLGLVLLLMKYLEIGPVAKWDWYDQWYLFAAPFILTILWWAYVDWSGYDKKKAQEKMDARKQERLNKNRVALGTDKGRGKGKVTPKR
jgi:small Trp-rich protein